MKNSTTTTHHLSAAALAATVAIGMLPAAATAWVYETDAEFFSNGDFNGDNRPDIVVVDKVTGAYRVGYRRADQTLHWSSTRAGGVDDITGCTIGSLLATNKDAIALTSPAANRINVIDAADTNAASAPLSVYLSNGLGPFSVAAVDIGGGGNASDDDLFACSILNNPSQGSSHFHFIRMTNGAASTITTTSTNVGSATDMNRILLDTNMGEFVAMKVNGAPRSLLVYDLFAGIMDRQLFRGTLTTNVRFLAGHFNAATNLAQFLFYEPGTTNLSLAAVKYSSPIPYGLDFYVHFGFADPIDFVVAMEGTNQVAISFSNGARLDIFDFDAVQAPALVQSIPAPAGKQIHGATPLPDTDLVLLTASNRATRTETAQIFEHNGAQYSALGPVETLPRVSDLSGRANVHAYANEPFVENDPTRLGTYHHADWSSGFRLSGGPADMLATGEVDRGTSDGLGSAQDGTVAEAPAGALFGLVNQYIAPISVFNLATAVGEEELNIRIAPAPGLYTESIDVVLVGTTATVSAWYRLAPDADWTQFSQAIPLLLDTTVEYYGETGGGDQRTPIRSAAYTFDDSPDQLDGDGDGVPDYVEIGVGLDPFLGGDSDGDGLSDLEELLLGTDPTMPTTNPPPRLDQLGSFDVYVAPRPYDGAADLFGVTQTGNLHQAYSLVGSYLGPGTSTNLAIAGLTNPAVCIPTIPFELPLPFVVVTTEDNFIPAHTNEPVGRELVRLLTMPSPPSVTLTNTYFGDDLGVAASNWIADATSLWAQIERSTVTGEMTIVHTLEIVLFECAVEEALSARGHSFSNGLALLPFRATDAGREPPGSELLSGIETYVSNTPSYSLNAIHDHVQESVANTGSAGVAELRELTKQIYGVSSRLSLDNPGTYALPLDVLRDFLKNGVLPEAYTNELSISIGDILQAATAASNLLAAIPSRTFTTLDLRTESNSFTDACTTLLDPVSAVQYSLFEVDGDPYSFPASFQLAAGSDVRVRGFIEPDAAPCGGTGVQVVAASLLAIPRPGPTDVDGDLMDDDYELLVFGSLVEDGDGDKDADGFSNLQEFLDGTHPCDNANIPSNAVADLSPPELDILVLPDGTIQIQWPWPEPYQDDFDFTLFSTDDIELPFVPVPVPVMGSSNCLIATNPVPINGRRFWRIGFSLD